ncbi:type II secretion system F family protein [Azonexus sp.]|uniref:type II secretion system F family protein n=1 Tax=Azonexus sp. TaxID=1872668 RepID=UPI0039E25829
MHFEYLALDPQGQLVRGRQEAAGRAVLCAMLAARGLDPLRLRRCWFGGRSPSTGLTAEDVHGLTQHLAHYLRAGLHLSEALQDLAEHAETPALRQLGQNLAQAVENGQAVSQALRPLLRPEQAYVAETIAAGEHSGSLPELMQRLSEALQRSARWRQETRRALLYPCLAGGVAGAACLFLLLFLVPQIEVFLHASAQTLPWHSRALFAVAGWVRDYGKFFLLLPLAILVLFFTAPRYLPQLPYLLARAQWRWPLFGRITQALHLAQLADLLGLLYAAGIPLAQALGCCAASCRNRVLAENLTAIQDAVQEGQGLSLAFTQAERGLSAGGNSALFPAFFLQLLRAGEKTGQLEHSLRHLAEHYDATACAAMARVHLLIEPALTLLVGIFLGWVVLATLQPLYALIGKAL